jgi:UDP-N-acetylmuramate dehydrogenase
LAGAQISPKHVLALSNSGDATAADLLALAKEVQGRVQEKFKIHLEFEVQVVGNGLN